MKRYRPTYAEVDLGAIRSNISSLLGCVREGTRSYAVVKANAYGHGDVEVAEACLEAGASGLAVALVEEGVRLREAGVDAPVLVLVEATPDAAPEIVRRGLTPSVFTREGAEALSEAAAVGGRPVEVHVCIDTGMHREGASLRDAVDLTVYAAKLPGVEVVGVWSHLAVADEADHPFTSVQIERFAEACEAIGREGIEVRMRHLANSAGTIAHPSSHFDMVRMGVALYGLPPAPWLASRCELRRAMRLVSSVGSVRRVGADEGISYGLTYAPIKATTVATVLIGYGDGYARLLSNASDMLVGGKRRRVAGRVTMDQTMVVCGDDDVAVGDEVVCFGRQGSEEITADEIADLVGTINYEVVCTVGPRVPRVYIS